MAGVPVKSVELYLRKLLQSGHRVAICDQVEDPALAKGLVKREVTRVVTPGTITEDNLLDPRRPNYLVALALGPGRALAGVAWLDLSTGQFQAADFPTPRLADEMARLAPPECLRPENEAERLGGMLERLNPAPRFTTCPDWMFQIQSARTTLLQHFRVGTLAGFGLDDDQPCIGAAGALLQYVQETLKADLGHIRCLQPYRAEQFLLLDEV